MEYKAQNFYQWEKFIWDEQDMDAASMRDSIPDTEQ
jgi:hypothetical protein